MSPPPGVVVGGYFIEPKLGAGGFGKVYLAWRDGRPERSTLLSTSFMAFHTPWLDLPSGPSL
ncbi:MAG: hypothetical protein ACXU86_16100 [Archangium sp.]